MIRRAFIAAITLSITVVVLFPLSLTEYDNNYGIKATSIIGPTTVSTNMEQQQNLPLLLSGNNNKSQKQEQLLASTTINSLDNNNDDDEYERNSSVDYMACCGLGHRLTRMANAYYIAKIQQFELRSFWGWCGDGNKNETIVEIYTTLFHPPPPSKTNNDVSSSKDYRIRFVNQVPGFVELQRIGTDDNEKEYNNECPCIKEKIESDLEFYHSLRERFKYNEQVQQYIKKHFITNKFVIGLHIRGGNGEKGDFERKKRQINNPTLWVHNVVNNIKSLIVKVPNNLSPVLYVATDTPLFINLLKTELQDDNTNIQILEWKQERMENGKGVFFGMIGKVMNKYADQKTCLQRWIDTIIDMILLSYTDVIIAGRLSSFTQTMPMSIIFGKETNDRIIQQNYCEIDNNNDNDDGSTTMRCFESYIEWCCKYKSSSEKELVQVLSNESRRNGLPTTKVIKRPTNLNDCRPRPGRRVKTFCLPRTSKGILT